MKKKLTLAAILFAVLLALGGLATWDEWKTKQDKEVEKSRGRIAEFKSDDVIEVDYYSKGAAGADEMEAAKPDDNPKTEGVTEVIAVKKDGTWRLTKPVDVQADAATIDSLVKTVTDYAYAKVITDKRDQWAEYGLLEPKRHVTLRVGGDKPQVLTVYVGNKTPVGYDVYLRTSADDKVLMGSQHLLASTAKSLNDFRDKTLVKIDEGKLKTFTYARRGEPAIQLTKADGKYQIVQPEKLEGDGAGLRDFIDTLSGVRVVQFYDNPDTATRALFDAPEYAFTWQGETGEASTLKVIDKDGKLLAAFDPKERVFGLPDELKSKLKKELSDFRNRRILEPDSLDAKTVAIDGETFRNVQGNWYAEADAAKLDDQGKPKGGDKVPEKDRPTEKAHIRAFMVDLEFAKTDRFLPLTDPAAKALADAAPLHRIVLSYTDPAKKPVTIELYKSDADDKYFIRRTGAPAVYRVTKSAFNSMTPAKEPPAAGSGPGKEQLAPDEEGGGLDDLPPAQDGKSSDVGTGDDDAKAG